VKITREYETIPELKGRLPEMLSSEKVGLQESLLKTGYDPQNPIIIWEGKNIIVDGHHRYELCKELGIEPMFKEMPFDSIREAEKYVLEHYIQEQGRGKSETQIAEAIVSLDNLIEGLQQAAKARMEFGKKVDPSPLGDQGNPETGQTTQKIADRAGISRTTVTRVLAVHKKGIPELRDMMIKDELGAKAAEEFVQSMPKEKQVEIVKEGGAKAVKKFVREIRKEKKDAAEFDKFNDPVKKNANAIIASMRKVKAATGGACLLPNVREMYCNDCKWGFDIYLPPPNEAKCPYCCGTNVEQRDVTWNSREAMLNDS